MDLVTYSLLMKKIKGLVSGIKEIKAGPNHTIIFVLKDNSTISVQLPTPQDGKSFVDAELNQNGELIIIDSDNNRINVGSVIGPKGDKGDKGDDGKSAYDLAVAAGFSGTQTEWLASLKGLKGDDGLNGRSIISIEPETDPSKLVDGKQVLKITYSDSTSSNVVIEKEGVSEIHKIKSETISGRIVDTYNVYTGNGYNSSNENENKIGSFEVTNGKDGSGIGGDAQLTEAITSNIQVGAAASGTTFAKDMSFTEFAKKLLLNEIAPTIEFTATGSGVKEAGTSVTTPTLKVKITNKGTGTPTSIDFYSGSTKLQTVSYTSGTNEYSYTMTTNITTDTTLKGVLNYKKSDNSTSSVNKTASYSFIYPSYNGTVSTLAVDETTIKGLTKVVRSSKGFTWSNIILNDARTCYAYPKSLGALSSITDGNGFGILNSYTRTEQTVNGQTYYVYVLTDALTADGAKHIFA